jgi:integrase
MPKQVRVKTKYPGVYYIEADGARGKEKIFYVVYRRNGKQIEEKAGSQYVDDMTEAKAAGIRADRLRGKELPNTEKRKVEKAAKLAEEERPTLSKIWKEYKAQRPDSIPIKYDGYRFDKYLRPRYGDKTPSELHQLDIDRLRIELLKIKAPQTVKHVLGLLKRLCNFGVKKQLCEGIGFKIEMPRVDNQRTEDLSPDELKNLLDAMEASPDVTAATFMKMALFTGMRRGELMKLRWRDVDFDRRFIHILNPKGGVSVKIPLNDQARKILEDHPKTSDYVFARNNGLPFTNAINKRVRQLKRPRDCQNDSQAPSWITPCLRFDVSVIRSSRYVHFAETANPQITPHDTTLRPPSG